MNADNYKTNDFALAVTLLCYGFNILELDRTNPRRVYFIYNQSEALESAVSDFWDNKLTVNPKTFLSTQKELKARVFSD